VGEFVQRHRGSAQLPVDLNVRMRFNPNLEQAWFGALMEIINNVTMLSIILTGRGADPRARARHHRAPAGHARDARRDHAGQGVVHGAGGAAGGAVALVFVVQGALHVPVQGSVLLFMGLAALHLFATTSMGIFLATVARSMPQFGMLLVLTLLPLQCCRAAVTPRESMPEFVQQRDAGRADHALRGPPHRPSCTAAPSSRSTTSRSATTPAARSCPTSA
jgi:ABC-2 type transport system permease protein